MGGRSLPRKSDSIAKKPEGQRIANIAFFLDVDGVITDPTEKKVIEPQVFDHIIENLTAGNSIALITGRSNEWMIER